MPKLEKSIYLESERTRNGFMYSVYEYLVQSTKQAYVLNFEPKFDRLLFIAIIFADGFLWKREVFPGVLAPNVRVGGGRPGSRKRISS